MKPRKPDSVKSARVTHGGWFRRAPTVVSYWKGRRLVFHNYFSSVQVTAPPVVAEVLHFFDTWRSAEELVAAAPHAARLLEQLAEQTLLERWDGRGTPPAAIETPWGDWEPEAGLLHFSTKDHFDTDQDSRGVGAQHPGQGDRSHVGLARAPAARRVEHLPQTARRTERARIRAVAAADVA